MDFEGVATIGYLNESAEETQIENEPLKKSSTASETSPQQPSGCFDCNICLDFTVDPVVTLCGHLYCWPCIYKWLQIYSHDSVHQCPVCKASLSQDSLVPLYGRGHSSKRAHQTFDIPQRPNSLVHHHHHQHQQQQSQSEEEENYFNGNQHRHHHYHVHQHEHHHHYPYVSPLGAMNRVINSTAGGVLGGMAIAVLPWMFRNNQLEGVNMQLSSPSPYYAGVNGGSPRQRRHEREVESSLHQIWVFLFCCAMLCLLLF